MRGISRYAKLILFLCVGSIIFCAIFGTLPSILRRVNKVVVKQMKYRQQIKEELLRNEQVHLYLILLRLIYNPFFFYCAIVKIKKFIYISCTIE